jgi:hypothetical protein
LAGRIQQSGRFAMLVPRELGLSVITASIPLPPAKPAPSLASYAFRPASLPAKTEPSKGSGGTVRPSTVHPVEALTRRQPSMVAARTLGPSELPSPTKPKSSQVAARAVAVKTPESSGLTARALQSTALAPAKPGKSQVASRARPPDARPLVTTSRLPAAGAQTVQSAAPVPQNTRKSQVTTGARQPATNLIVQEARRRSPR